MGGVHPLGGRGPLTWVLFGENVCENERIGSHSRWRAPGTPSPRSANGYFTTKLNTFNRFSVCATGSLYPVLFNFVLIRMFVEMKSYLQIILSSFSFPVHLY